MTGNIANMEKKQKNDQFVRTSCPSIEDKAQVFIWELSLTSQSNETTWFENTFFMFRECKKYLASKSFGAAGAQALL